MLHYWVGNEDCNSILSGSDKLPTKTNETRVSKSPLDLTDLSSSVGIFHSTDLPFNFHSTMPINLDYSFWYRLSGFCRIRTRSRVVQRQLNKSFFQILEAEGSWKKNDFRPRSTRVGCSLWIYRGRLARYSEYGSPLDLPSKKGRRGTAEDVVRPWPRFPGRRVSSYWSNLCVIHDGSSTISFLLPSLCLNNFLHTSYLHLVRLLAPLAAHLLPRELRCDIFICTRRRTRGSVQPWTVLLKYTLSLFLTSASTSIRDCRGSPRCEE